MAPPTRSNPRRAGAQFAWTEPLRERHQHHERLHRASWRLGVIALGAAFPVAVARAPHASAWGLGLLVGTMLIVGVGALWVARRAGAEARRLEAEMAGIEEEARRHLG